MYLAPSVPRTWASVTTKQFTLQGSHLEVNVAMLSAEGMLLVAVINAATGRAFAGFSCVDTAGASREGVHLRVRWEKSSSLSHLVGSLIQLRFYFIDANIYAFEIKDG